MGRKTSLTSLHLGINKTTSFLSVEIFPKDLRLSILHDILFITKLRIGWRPLKFWIKNRRFPNKKPFLYSPKYFYHSIKIIKSLNKVLVDISIWDVNTNKKANQHDVLLNRRAKNFGKKFKKNFRKPFYIIAENVYNNHCKSLEVKTNFQKGSFWLSKLSKLDLLKKKTDTERFNMSKLDYSYLKQKEFRFLIKHKHFGFLMQCFLYSVYKLNTDLLLKLFSKTLRRIRKRGNRGRIMMKHFLKMIRLLPFFFEGQNIGLTIFLRGRLWLSFRKKRLKLSFGAVKRNTFNKTISESTGKVFTRYGVFGIKIVMSKSNIN
jgi:hypothetical protein